MTDFRSEIRLLRRHAGFIVVALVAVVATAAVSSPRVKSFRAEALVYIGAQQATDPSGQVRTDPMVAAARLMPTFAVMIDSEPVARLAVAESGVARAPGAVVAATSATVEPATQLLRVAVSDGQPRVARDLANAMARAFLSTIHSYEPTGRGSGGLVATVVAPATLPSKAQQGPLERNVVASAVFGLLAAIGVVLGAEKLDVTVRDAADAAWRLELPVLGDVPLDRRLLGRRRPAPPAMGPGVPG